MIALHHDEAIKRIARKHWFLLVGEVLGLSLLLVLPLLTALFAPLVTESVGAPSLLQDVDARILIFASALWFLILWIRFFYVWTDYYLDVWLVTNERIIDVEQHGFFKREVSTFRFDQIQDITVEVRGLVRTLLGFGDIHVQTAGADRELVIRDVANPNALRDLISHEHDRAMRENGKDVYQINQ